MCPGVVSWLVCFPLYPSRCFLSIWYYFGGNSVIVSSNIASFPFLFLVHLVFSLHICYIFFSCPTVLGSCVLCFFSLFPLCSSVLKVSAIMSSSETLPSGMSRVRWAHHRHSSFPSQYLLLTLPFHSFLEFSYYGGKFLLSNEETHTGGELLGLPLRLSSCLENGWT